MSWKHSAWEASLDARCAALAARAKREGHNNTVTVRYVEPTMPKARRRKKRVGQ